MPASRTLKRSYSVKHLGVNIADFTTGVWTMQLSSGIFSMHKAAAASVSVFNVAIPHAPRGGFPTNEDAQVSIVELFYLVSTANMTSAPTCVFNRHTFPGGTGTGFVAITATPAPTMTYAGVDTVGTANGAGATGSHIAVATLATPYTFIDTDSLVATYTMNEAATTVLDIFGITVTYV